MSGGRMQHVQLEPSPLAQLLGDAAVLRGLAALDIYRLVIEGIQVTQSRDAISPSLRLLQSVAVLKAAAYAPQQAAGAGVTATTEVAEIRQPPTRGPLRTGEVIGAKEVAQMCGVGVRQATNLAPSLGGWRSAGRNRPWAFDRGLVQAYLANRER